MQKEIQALKEDLKTKTEMSEEIRVAEEEKTKMLEEKTKMLQVLQEKLLASRMMPQANPGTFVTIILFVFIPESNDLFSMILNNVFFLSSRGSACLQKFVPD